MEVEHFAEQLHQKLKEKVEDNSTYRKAEGVLQSLIHAGQTVSLSLYRSQILIQQLGGIPKRWLYI